MEKLDNKSYKALIKGAETLTEDLYGKKVLKLKDGRIAKLFRLKRVFSSALLMPYARRFVRGVKILENHNIPTVNVTGLYKIPSIKRDMVVYHPLKGESLREMIAKKENTHELISQFISFFAKLHDNRIYFRAIHFNNVFITPKGEFGLIDISDLHWSPLPFIISKRVRNFKPFLHYTEDRKALEAFSLDKFIDIYIKKSKIKPKNRQIKLKKAVLQLYGESDE